MSATALVVISTHQMASPPSGKPESNCGAVALARYQFSILQNSSGDRVLYTMRADSMVSLALNAWQAEGR